MVVPDLRREVDARKRGPRSGKAHGAEKDIFIHASRTTWHGLPNAEQIHGRKGGKNKDDVHGDTAS